MVESVYKAFKEGMVCVLLALAIVVAIDLLMSSPPTTIALEIEGRVWANGVMVGDNSRELAIAKKRLDTLEGRLPTTPIPDPPSQDIDPDGATEYPGLPEGFEAGSIRGDISYMTSKGGKAAGSVDNAARWVALILMRFHRDGLQISFGRRQLFPVHIELDKEKEVEK